MRAAVVFNLAFRALSPTERKLLENARIVLIRAVTTVFVGTALAGSMAVVALLSLMPILGWGILIGIAGSILSFIIVRLTCRSFVLATCIISINEAIRLNRLLDHSMSRFISVPDRTRPLLEIERDIAWLRLLLTVMIGLIVIAVIAAAVIALSADSMKPLVWDSHDNKTWYDLPIRLLSDLTAGDWLAWVIAVTATLGVFLEEMVRRQTILRLNKRIAELERGLHEKRGTGKSSHTGDMNRGDDGASRP
jgi:hypothetical protein